MIKTFETRKLMCFYVAKLPKIEQQISEMRNKEKNLTKRPTEWWRLLAFSFINEPYIDYLQTK